VWPVVFKVMSLCMHAAMFATGFVDDALRNTVPSRDVRILRQKIAISGSVICKFCAPFL